MYVNSPGGSVTAGNIAFSTNFIRVESLFFHNACLLS